MVDPDDPVFLPPGDMPGRIASWLAGRGEAAPAEPAETVRCILDSLALAYRRAITAGAGAVRPARGRGAHRRRRIPQLAAVPAHRRRHRRCPWWPGPAEATCFGNVLVQARALGAAPGDLAGMRALIRVAEPLRDFAPAGDGAAWAAAEARITR